jgi:hypothetical protein
MVGKSKISVSKPFSTRTRCTFHPWYDTSGIFVGITLLIMAEGSSVAVERIISGGRETISLQRASLQPETIQVLVLKNCLQLTCYHLSND